MYKEKIKQFAKRKKNWRLIQTKQYPQNIGMEFGIEKWTMRIMKSGKREITEE